MSDAIPTFDPDDYWRAIGVDRPHVHAPQEDDFSTLLPHVPVGEVLPDAVVVDGAIVTPPKQARGYASFAPLLDRIGPGAAAMVERELDRAHAYKVIAEVAVRCVNATNRGDLDAANVAWQELDDTVRENQAAIT